MPQPIAQEPSREMPPYLSLSHSSITERVDPKCGCVRSEGTGTHSGRLLQEAEGSILQVGG